MSQNINISGLFYFPWVRYVKKSLGIPHFHISDISSMNPEKMKHYGIYGLLFDKDNTLTLPYSLDIYPPLQQSFIKMKEIFGDKIAILSNSAGTLDDQNYHMADTIESHLGIKVIRHKSKKPGGIEGVIEYFQCKPTSIAMIGDRIFTDIVYGNLNGMLTFHTIQLTPKQDNKIAATIRNYEVNLVKKWENLGLKAPDHPYYHPEMIFETQK